MVSEQNSFDPSYFNDPVAMNTKWTPLKSGGSSFLTHKLVKVHSNRIEFRSSIGAKLFYIIFILVGIGIAIGFTYPNFMSGDFSYELDSFWPVLMGLVFLIIGGYMFFRGTSPIVFDKLKKSFWKGRKSPDKVYDKSELKHFAELDEIHALQLISEYIRGNKSSYYSYELNLVLESGKRINVVDHGNQNKLREDADMLSKFLDKPVWDAI